MESTIFANDGKEYEIRNVWANNLDKEMALVREACCIYPFVAMDTEFPGVVSQPIPDKNKQDTYFKTVTMNANFLKIIQIGITFFDKDGNHAKDCPAWQFNFKFDKEKDEMAKASIDMLEKCGLNFDTLRDNGIDPCYFGELFNTCGLTYNENLTWISFHSGYDFAYLLHLISSDDLPQDQGEFFQLLDIVFPNIIDIKYIAAKVGLKGGLSKVSDELLVTRIGPSHQAGSDSILTGDAFFQLINYPETKIDYKQYVGVLYGFRNGVND